MASITFHRFPTPEERAACTTEYLSDSYDSEPEGEAETGASPPKPEPPKRSPREIRWVDDRQWEIRMLNKQHAKTYYDERLPLMEQLLKKHCKRLDAKLRVAEYTRANPYNHDFKRNFDREKVINRNGLRRQYEAVEYDWDSGYYYGMRFDRKPPYPTTRFSAGMKRYDGLNVAGEGEYGGRHGTYEPSSPDIDGRRRLLDEKWRRAYSKWVSSSHLDVKFPGSRYDQSSGEATEFDAQRLPVLLALDGNVEDIVNMMKWYQCGILETVAWGAQDGEDMRGWTVPGLLVRALHEQGKPVLPALKRCWETFAEMTELASWLEGHDWTPRADETDEKQGWWRMLSYAKINTAANDPWHNAHHAWEHEIPINSVDCVVNGSKSLVGYLDELGENMAAEYVQSILDGRRKRGETEWQVA